MEEYLKFAKDIALRAGDIMIHYFDLGEEGREKADKTLVTKADEEINQMVITEVAKRFPDHAVFGEEASSSNKSKQLWSCDPIDGTTQFAKGVPIAVFSLAYVEDGKPLVGVVYDPFTKRLYSANKGSGAFLNDVPINVSKKPLNYQAIVDLEWWPEAEYELYLPSHTLTMETSAYVLTICSVTQAAMKVAAGQYEGCVFAGTKGKSVDLAAAKVIVEEAGGIVTDLFGKDQRYDGDIKGGIISNGVVHKNLLSYFKLT